VKRISENVLSTLRRHFRGDLITPERPDYPNAVKIWNAMMDDRRPSLIARPTGAVDVMVLVRTAREHDIPLAVRGGGHSGAGRSTLNDGIVLDLSSMRRVRVDPKAGITYSEGGALWQDYDHENQPFGVATPGGVISTTGVGGFALGGGIGWLGRRFGLTCDNLVGAEIVDAEGRRIICNENENPDLLWGLRGAGGNFGVTTTLELRHHFIGHRVYEGSFLYLDHCEEAFSLFNEFGERDNLPRELGLYCGMITIRDFDFIPPDLRWKKACAVLFSWTGKPEVADKLLDPFVKLKPTLSATGNRTYKDLQSMYDPLAPHGNRSYWKSGYVNSIPPKLASIMVARGRSAPSPLSQGEFILLGGRIADVPNSATAFGDRTGRFVYNLISNWTDASKDADNVAWARGFFDDLKPFSTGAAYANFLGDEHEDRSRDAFGQNYDKLAQLKLKYDPTNLFRQTQNVKPATAAVA
jgi:FAD binding domain/Berberine and berberine like